MWKETTNLIFRFLRRQIKLRADNITNTIGDKQHRTDSTPLRHAAHIRSNQTEREGNVGRKDRTEAKSSHFRDPSVLAESIDEQ